MQTEKAEIFNSFINEAWLHFKAHKQKKRNDESIPQEVKNLYTTEMFSTHFTHFIDELKQNIRLYKDINLIRDYVITLIKSNTYSIIFYTDDNAEIIKNAYEIGHLLQLKQNIAFYMDEIQECIDIDDTPTTTTSLRYYFNEEMKTMAEADGIEYESDEFQPEPRFLFSNLKLECDNIENTVERIQLINDRLFDFEQWQVEYDKLTYDRSVGQYYEYTATYYSDFTRLCTIELHRQKRKLELENEKIKQKALEKNSVIIQTSEKSPFKWNATDTDFLELFAALFQNESIVRADGKQLTRKELLDYFQRILGLEVKDVEGKLTKAGNRNDNTAFLDSLAQQFRNYVAGKEKRLNSRK